jgi:RNA polymerase sigma factor (sigma-70 family)
LIVKNVPRNGKDYVVDESYYSQYWLSGRYCGQMGPANETERQDWIAAGTIGLWQGLQKYDPSRGYKLSTYVRRPIRWQILKEIRKKDDNKTYEIRDIETMMDQSAVEQLWEYYPNNLTKDEEKIMNLRVAGYSNEEIAGQIGIDKKKIGPKLRNIVLKIKEADALKKRKFYLLQSLES